VNVLITGANGFLGSQLMKSFGGNREVSVLGIYHRRKENLPGRASGRFSYQYADLANKEDAYEIFKNNSIEAVIHAAACISKRNDSDYIADALENNVRSQANLVSAAIEYDCKRYVYCSTIGVYGCAPEENGLLIENDPKAFTDVYGWSKYAAEEILRVKTQKQRIMKGVTLRFAGVHGRGRESGVIYRMVRAALLGEPIKVDEPESRFRFLFMGDAVQAIKLALFSDVPALYNCYNVAGRDICSLLELAIEIKKITGSSSEILISPGGTPRSQALDISRIERDMNFSPQTLRENLHQFVRTADVKAIKGNHGKRREKGCGARGF